MNEKGIFEKSDCGLCRGDITKKMGRGRLAVIHSANTFSDSSTAAAVMKMHMPHGRAAPVPNIDGGPSLSPSLLRVL